MPPISLSRDASFGALFGANPGYPYFEGGDQRPFCPEAPGYAPENAWWLAELSLLAYLRDRDLMDACLRRAGITGLRVFESGRTHTQCLVAMNAAMVWVVFRGTEVDSLRDLLTDVDLIWSRDPAGRVHRGFKRALDSVWSGLSAHLETLAPRPIWLTGHSLGGALATLAAHHLGARAAGLYTYGCPRVGDQAFARGVHCPAWRVVNSNDIVPRLPPVPYRPVGRLCYLDRHGRLHRDAPASLRLDDRWRGHWRHAGAVLKRWRAGDWRVVFNDELYDHAPIHYARCLRALVFAEAPAVDDRGSPQNRQE